MSRFGKTVIIILTVRIYTLSSCHVVAYKPIGTVVNTMLITGACRYFDNLKLLKTVDNPTENASIIKR